MKTDLRAVLRATNDAAKVFAVVPHKKRRAVLRTLASILQAHKSQIFSVNRKDIQTTRRHRMSEAYIDRLTFTEKTFHSMIAQVRDIASAKDVLHITLESRRISGGVLLKRITVPLGVIGIIYESRPNVTIDVAALCIMSGNACVLKGGSDALHTNRALCNCVQESLQRHRLPAGGVTFLGTKNRSVIDALVKANGLIDVLIPRGGYGLIKKVVAQSRIPILYHAAGGARIYIDSSADLKQAIRICVDSKTNRPATCNSLDTVLVHKNVARNFIPQLVSAFRAHGVEVRGDAKTAKIVAVKKAREADNETEYLDLIVLIKVVSDLDEAIAFTNRYGKKHTEGIVAKNKNVVSRFIEGVDAASILVNCSTRLHDGGVYGLGAEMGIATGKLHARGPVGLSGLTTYKWVAYGRGQLRA